MELSRFEQIKLTAATGTKGRARSTSPILLTLC